MVTSQALQQKITYIYEEQAGVKSKTLTYQETMWCTQKRKKSLWIKAISKRSSIYLHNLFTRTACVCSMQQQMLICLLQNQPYRQLWVIQHLLWQRTLTYWSFCYTTPVIISTEYTYKEQTKIPNVSMSLVQEIHWEKRYDKTYCSCMPSMVVIPSLSPTE